MPDLLRAIELHAATSDGDESAESGPPEWIHIAPPGPVVQGRDGRQFRVEDAEAVIAQTRLPAMIDIDHQSFFGETRSYGWVDAIEFDEGDGDREAGFWGHIEGWTPGGERLVLDRDYRFLSPAIHTEQEEDNEVAVLRAFENFALTNRPNLTLQQLHAQLPHQETPTQEGAMPGETTEQLHARIRQLEEERDRREAEAHARIEELEEEKRQREAEQRRRAIEALLDTHTQRGAIAPAQREHFRAFAEADIEAATAALESMPDRSGRQPRPTPTPDTETHAQARAAFRAKFGLRDMSQEGSR